MKLLDLGAFFLVVITIVGTIIAYSVADQDEKATYKQFQEATK